MDKSDSAMSGRSVFLYFMAFLESNESESSAEGDGLTSKQGNGENRETENIPSTAFEFVASMSRFGDFPCATGDSKSSPCMSQCLFFCQLHHHGLVHLDVFRDFLLLGLFLIL